ncbi:MAG: ABC transporter ATP-binding protein [Planctomycetes bacterium]|nr:ABC transporter ATP-binding protein [Planctomycetota bacterium]
MTADVHANAGRAVGVQPTVRVHRVWKRFGSRDALAGVSLSVAPGECVALLGRNGSGKTTLVRILATLDTASEGEIDVAGLSLPREETAVRGKIGVVLDHSFLPRDLRLEEGLRFYGELYGVPSPLERARVLAAKFGLGTRLTDPVRTLSRGMAQRASLCRALMHDPPVLLLDEPSTALDADGCRLLVQTIREHAARGRSVLLVTHDLPLAAAAADRALLLRKGKVVAEGAAAGVCAQAESEGSVAA